MAAGYHPADGDRPGQLIAEDIGAVADILIHNASGRHATRGILKKSMRSSE